MGRTVGGNNGGDSVGREQARGRHPPVGAGSLEGRRASHRQGGGAAAVPPRRWERACVSRPPPVAHFRALVRADGRGVGQKVGRGVGAPGCWPLALSQVIIQAGQTRTWGERGVEVPGWEAVARRPGGSNTHLHGRSRPRFRQTAGFRPILKLAVRELFCFVSVFRRRGLKNGLWAVRIWGKCISITTRRFHAFFMPMIRTLCMRSYVKRRDTIMRPLAWHSSKAIASGRDGE